MAERGGRRVVAPGLSVIKGHRDASSPRRLLEQSWTALLLHRQSCAVAFESVMTTSPFWRKGKESIFHMDQSIYMKNAYPKLIQTHRRHPLSRCEGLAQTTLHAEESGQGQVCTCINPGIKYYPSPIVYFRVDLTLIIYLTTHPHWLITQSLTRTRS